MAGIDLPQIAGPNAPGVAGGYLSEFGTELMNLGVALGKQRQYAPEQQALLDAQTAKEVIAAKSLAYDKVNAFNKELETNTDYQHYGDAWTNFKATINDEVSNVLSLPSSKQQFEEWWLPESDKQNDYVAQQSRLATVASAQAQAQVAIERFAANGQEGAIKSTLREMVSVRLWTASEASNVAKEFIPRARYNFILQQLDKLGDPNAAIDTLTNPEASQRFQLDPEQIDKMRVHFENVAQSRETRAAEEHKQKQEQLASDFLTRTIDPKTQPTEEDARLLLPGLVDNSFLYKMIEGYADAALTERKRIQKETETFSMAKNYVGFNRTLANWNGNDDPPWNEDSIAEAFVNKSITEPEYNKLSEQFKQTMDDLRTGKRQGPNYLDPKQEQKAYEIAFDNKNGWTGEQKSQRIYAFLGRGIPGNIVKQIADAAIEIESPTNKARKGPLDAIATYYDGKIAALIQSSGPGGRADVEDKIREAAYEKYQAQQTMLQFIRTHASDEKSWSEQVDKVLSGKAATDAVQAMVEQYKIRFPAFGSYFTGQGPRFSPEMQLEAARTQGFVTDVPSRAKWQASLSKIQQQEIDFLSQHGIKEVVDSKRAPNDEMNYLTKDGTKYKVVQEPVNGVMRNVIYKVVNDRWVKVK